MLSGEEVVNMYWESYGDNSIDTELHYLERLSFQDECKDSNSIPVLSARILPSTCLKASWCSQMNMGKLDDEFSINDLLPGMGVCLQNNIYLSNEECLYLMEMNKLTLQFNGLMLSMEEAFSIINVDMSFICYRAFRRLLNYGFYVRRRRQNLQSFYPCSSIAVSSKRPSATNGNQARSLKRKFKEEDDSKTLKRERLINTYGEISHDFSDFEIKEEQIKNEVSSESESCFESNDEISDMIIEKKSLKSSERPNANISKSSPPYFDQRESVCLPANLLPSCMKPFHDHEPCSSYTIDSSDEFCDSTNNELKNNSICIEVQNEGSSLLRENDDMNIIDPEIPVITISESEDDVTEPLPCSSSQGVSQIPQIMLQQNVPCKGCTDCEVISVHSITSSITLSDGSVGSPVYISIEEGSADSEREEDVISINSEIHEISSVSSDSENEIVVVTCQDPEGKPSTIIGTETNDIQPLIDGVGTSCCVSEVSGSLNFFEKTGQKPLCDDDIAGIYDVFSCGKVPVGNPEICLFVMKKSVKLGNPSVFKDLCKSQAETWICMEIGQELVFLRQKKKPSN